MKLCPTCQRCYDDADAICPQDNMALVPSHPGSRLIVNKYRLERLLGRGGMGAVYAGTHVDLERPVAIKLLLPDLIADSEAMERFRREALAAARLNHPNIADTYDYGMLPDGGAYIVMELVDGLTLREYMNTSGPLSINVALHIATQIAVAIEAAHAGGIVHRDLKPSNIVIRLDRDERWEAKVVDFGVAKLKEQTTSARGGLTGTGSLIGTPRYMSPEQCMGQKTDTRSDIYSLGVILYEMLAGQPPFDAPSATAIAIKHIQETPPSILDLRPDVPERLAQLMVQVLAKDPQARPQSAAEFARVLKEVVHELPETGMAGSDLLLAIPKDQSTSEKTSGPDTNPPQLQGPQTQRANHPTEESISGPQEIQDAPSVMAYDSPPLAVSETAAANKAIEQPSHPNQRDAAAAPAVDELQPLSGRHAQNKLFDEARETHGKRTALLIYVGLAAVTLIATFVIVDILWPALRNRQDAETVASDGKPAVRAQVNDSPSTTSTASTASEPARIANQSNSASPSPSTKENGDAPAELRTLLKDWIMATNTRDVNRQMEFYAPTLESFYLRHNATRTAVREEKARLFRQLSSVNVTATEPEVMIGSDGKTAAMRFYKSWNFTGARTESGEVIQELRWRKTEGGWKIISERDLQRIR
jgi:serine/threonine-protein kinase